MIIRISILLLFLSCNLAGQAVNEKIDVLLSQAPLLRVNAGYDMIMDEDGSVVIGESVYIYGGTSEFSFEWMDELQNYYYEKSPLVSNTGDYLLTVTDAQKCSASDTLAVFPYTTVVLPNKERAALKVYFENTSSTLVLNVEGILGEVSLSIVNMNGALLLSQKLDLRNASELIQLNLSSFKQGMYLISLKDDQKLATAKFSIQ